MTQALDTNSAVPGQEAPGVGGGASAFTDLTDAPGPYAGHAKQLASVNTDEDGLEFTEGVTVDVGSATKQIAVEAFEVGKGSLVSVSSFADEEYADPSVQVSMEARVLSVGEGGPNTPSAELKMDVYDLEGGNAQFALKFQPDTVTGLVGASAWVLEKVGAAPLAVNGLDVAATDLNARLTIGEASYAIEKAIQVKIGEGTYYWPLFGGEDAGAAPAPEIALTDLTDCPGTLVETQEVLVAGVGTMTFTHGLLTGFTPV